MKILILSCNNGGGHNTVASAIAHRFNQLGATTDIMDSVAFFSKTTSHLMSQGHAMLYRKAPELMDKGYKREEEKQPKNGKTSNVYKLCAMAAPKVKKVLQNGSYNAVVCTHVFGALMVTEAKRKYDININCYHISTDYSCVVCLEETDMNAYFIPHVDLAAEFIANGIPSDKLIATGIPIREKCYTKNSKEQAKKELFLNPDKHIVLLMGGSMGAGPIKDIAIKLADRLPDNYLLIVICASNDKLRKSLHNCTGKNVRVLAYTKKLDVFMDAADLMITKPGGLTSTEIAVKSLPTIFIDAVMGCETQNMEFFNAHGYALRAANADDAASLCLKLAENNSATKLIIEKLHESFPKNATNDVCDKVIQDAKLLQ